MIETTAT